MYDIRLMDHEHFIDISTIFFILSIVCFFIRNGIRELTLKQIIVLSGYQVKRCKAPHLIVLSFIINV